MNDLSAAELARLFPNASGDVLLLNAAAEDVRARTVGRADLPSLALQLDQLEPSPAFRSQTEARAWAYVATLDPAPLARFYELIMFRLPSGNYTPDFTLVMPAGRLWFVEVKGKGRFKAHKSGRSSKKSLTEAGRLLAWLGRWWALLDVPNEDGGGWEWEEYTAADG